MKVKYKLFLIVTLSIMEFCMGLLKTGDEGVCTVKSSVRRTRTRVVTFYKWCGNKKRCIGKKAKPETYWVTSNVCVCCEGWVYSGEDDTCTPQCTGCLGGRCISPNVCQCDPPTFLDTEHKNCITPTCSPPCVNAYCDLNNTCHCKTDFNTFNATHCFKCDDGYTIDSNFECAPICTKKCVNGNCIAPNKCSCLPGFSSQDKDESTCEPVCAKCVNSKCTGPETCTCLEGYAKVNNSYCEPICDDCDGVCVKPNVCKCHDGYSKVKGVCTPVCDVTCVNGVCTAPGECSCYDGYVKKNSTVCYKPCEGCNGTCRHGECVEKDCLFTQTKVKTKWKGVRRMTYLDKVKQEACCDGWFWNKKEHGCRAVCDLGCEGGTCVEPNVCRCPPSLVLKENKKCVPPTCTDPCVNALCVNDDECTCNPDYIRINATHCGPQCLPEFHIDPITLNCICDFGFRIDPTNNTNCLPICEPECVNASCISPNTCSCHIGYEKTSATNCSPKCVDCDNGVCVAPNICLCHQGFAKNSVGKCAPVCSKPCINGYCVEPETCGCDNGYQLDNDDRYVCTPVCNSECVNAVCIAPNKCACLPGYEGTDEGIDCKPVCKRPCKNGKCVAPETCQCDKGYRLEAGECSPICNETCINGRCAAPDNCECYRDYLNNLTKPYECYKPCSGLCEHGTCNLDGQCLCHRGYEEENGTCVEMKPENCESCNGTCVDGCWCQDDRQPCFLAQSAEVAPTTTLAGMELSWVVAGAIIFLLIVVLMVVLQRIYSRRKKFEHKVASDYNTCGSVIYTVPNTLTRGFDDVDEDEKDNRSVYENDEDEKQAQKLLYTLQDDAL